MKKTDQNNRKRFGFSLLVNAVLLLYFLILFYCCFETDDDYTMKMIVSGVFGKMDSHINFIHVFAASFLQVLYQILPSFPWYETLQYLLIFLSLSVVTYVLLDKERNLFYDLLVYASLFVSAHFLYVELQFTKTAGILTLCGHLFLSYALNKENDKESIAAVLFLLLGLMFRRNQFMLISLVCVPLYIPFALQIFSDLKEKKISSKIVKLCMAGLFCLICLYGFRFADSLNYKDPGWKDYRRFNSARAAILDRDHLDYSDDPDFYNNIGLSEIDVKMLYECWDFEDPDVFTLEVFQAIREHQSVSKPEIVARVPDLIDASVFFFSRNKGNMMVLLMMTLTVVLCLAGKRDLKDVLALAMTILIVLFAYCFCYFYRNYAILARTHLSIMIAGLWILLYQTGVTKMPVRKMVYFGSVILLTIFMSSLWLDELRFNSSKRFKDDQKIAAIAEINKDSDHLYLRTADEGIDFISRLFIDQTVYMKDNLYSLGGWMTKMPLLEGIRDRYDAKNPFKDSVNNDKVYLLINSDDRLEMILEYIRKHYDKNAKTEFVKTIEANKTYSVYKIVSE